MQNDYSAIAKHIINENMYMTFATSTPDGTPWITPLYFNHDAKYNLYWLSAVESKHSKIITQNNRIAISIYNNQIPFGPKGPGIAVYIMAKAYIIDEKELKKVFTFFFNKVPEPRKSEIEKTLKIEDYISNSPRRFYKAIPQEIFIVGERKVYKGHSVDTRLKVEL